ncbi:MAG TPA: methionyl-tRNA formyltransferase [Kofleriaceae bacterium]|nr:methionyl-tRNA formyltransferase [Kofleriaceae bacterium]
MRVVFMGSPEFAVPCLRALHAQHEVVLVVSQPDKPAGRGGQLTAPAVKAAAQQLGLPVIQPRSARTGELRDAMVATGADLAVVVAYGKILPKPVLEALPRGCINVHGSLLPRYRGAAPVQWSVIHGDAETGVSIMQLDEGMDTGPVYLERSVAIDPDETAGELLERLAPIGAEALLEVIAGLAAGTARAAAQDPASASHAPMLAKADGAIDFGQPAAAVAARIRGVDPWPGAYATLRGQLVKLFRARAIVSEHAAGHARTALLDHAAPGAAALDHAAPGAVASDHTAPGAAASGHAAPGAASPGHAAPGTVLAIDAAGARVACGDGAVVVRELQAAGRKRLAAAQFAAGRGIAVGDVLGRPEPA